MPSWIISTYSFLIENFSIIVIILVVVAAVFLRKGYPRSAVWIDNLAAAATYGWLITYTFGFGRFPLILFIAGISAEYKLYTIKTEPYEGLSLVNGIGGASRGIGAGQLHAKSLLESVARKADMTFHVDDIFEQSFSMKGGSRIVEVGVAIHVHNSSEGIVNFSKYAPGAIWTRLTLLLKGLISPYFENLTIDKESEDYKKYGDPSMRIENLKKEVFEKPETKKLIAEFEKEHGVDVGLMIPDIKRPKAEQDLLDLETSLSSVGTTITELEHAMGSKEKAADYVMLRTLPNTSKEIFELQVPAHVTSVTFMGGLQSGKGGGKKK